MEAKNAVKHPMMHRAARIIQPKGSGMLKLKYPSLSKGILANDRTQLLQVAFSIPPQLKMSGLSRGTHISHLNDSVYMENLQSSDSVLLDTKNLQW